MSVEELEEQVAELRRPPSWCFAVPRAGESGS